MKYYNVIFYRGETPQGRAYTYYAADNEEYKHGDDVMVTGGRKGMISGVGTKEDAEKIGLDRIKAIVGLWKDDDKDE